MRGSEAFVEKAYLHSNAGSSEVTALRREIKYEDIFKAVSVRFDCDVHDLLRVKRGASVDNVARSVAIKVCQERGGMKLREIGVVFGIGSDSGVSKAISRITNRLLEDEQLRKVYKVICQDLTP